MSLLFEAFTHFRDLQERARAAGDPEPTAMTLSTANGQGRVSSRTVLLKELDGRGFVFYTNYESNKGQQILAHPQCALLFLWKTLDKQVQVKIEGLAEPVSHCEADAYFASRPRLSQIGAWASRQSRELGSREELMARVREFEQRFEGQDVPRPPHWSGFRVVPDMVEFWYGQDFRLHDRLRYELKDGVWGKRALYP
ncbi:MAG: pyridoxamine 5'-phosphate oxidase [Lysobacterales bacterium]|jgi:pyridoxamine 5'-phosphate oxidase|nr:pyridoxamine 5'-phosphate oxidase [Xanthomonadales bacterium]MCP5475168.1 pyridoxamine 5'-phosphate oxidase [Rhodanobacteraceae bacterium]